jgi:hypothetical protein
VTKYKLNQVVRGAMMIARRALVKDGYLLPVAIMLYGNDDQDVREIEFFDSDASKDTAARVLKERAAALNAHAVVLVFDTWMAHIDKDDPIPDKRVRDLPNAQDTILVSGSMSGYSVTALCTYTKDKDGEITLSDVSISEDVELSQCRFTKGLWSGTTH